MDNLSSRLIAVSGLRRQQQGLPLQKSTARVSLAEVFHPWVRWEGPGSGFESSSGAGGAWKSRIWPPWDEAEKQGF